MDEPRPSPPKDIPQPPSDPSVYGGQWGQGDGRNDGGKPPPDRPDPIKAPAEKN